ncbi:MAG: metallophosphoesterase family protein [Acidobacteriota bacterium]
MANRIPEDQERRRQRAAERAKLTRHRGLATWGEKLVPLGEFRDAVEQAGHRLSPEQRQEAVHGYRAAQPTAISVEGPWSRIAVFGGVYNNHQALAAVLEEATRRGAEAIYCLGDLGGFGPSPEKVWPLLEQGAVRTIQGNYEESLASGREDCNCGYTDPRDNHFARISYGYTDQNCSAEFKAWMGELPLQRRVRVGCRELLLVHGSPRRINEFLFASSAPAAFLEVLLDQNACDGLLCTHTGLHWHRRLPSGRDAINVGVIGRPANDGDSRVWFAMLEERSGDLEVELVPLVYDHQALAQEMRREELPEEFVETILTGWWTTCLEILPPRERASSKH